MTAHAAVATTATQDTRSLAAHLHFSPDHGHIQLFDQRMLLMHAGALAQLRRDIVLATGLDHARELMHRLGWQQGHEDGQRVRRLVPQPTPEALAQALSLGPRLREIEGFVLNQPVSDMRMDVARGELWGDFLWRDSWEAQAHLSHCGPSDRPVCWSMAGYADGFTLAVTGVAVQWREVECSPWATPAAASSAAPWPNGPNTTPANPVLWLHPSQRPMPLPMNASASATRQPMRHCR